MHVFRIGGQGAAIVGQRPGPLLLLFAVIGNQMHQRSFDKIAEAAAPGIGPTKIALEQADREVLKDFIGSVRILQHLAQIAADRSPIALDQLLPGRGHRLGRTVMRLEDKRPESRDPADPLVRVLVVHDRRTLPPGCERNSFAITAS